ncbi:MAG: hypothetical protein WCS80_03860 [Bacilli bacterium]
MNNNIDEIYQSMDDPKSCYVCGTSVFMSLIPIVKAIRNNSLDFDYGFGFLLPALNRLCEEDKEVYRLSMVKEPLQGEQWKTMIRGIDDYATVISDLDSLRDFLKTTGKGDIYKIVNDDYTFICSLCQNMLSYLYERNDLPPEFFVSAQNALLAVKGGNDNEKL